MNKSLDRRLKRVYKNQFEKRINKLIENSFDYCVIESKKIYDETQPYSQLTIEDLRTKFKNLLKLFIGSSSILTLTTKSRMIIILNKIYTSVSFRYNYIRNNLNIFMKNLCLINN